MTEEPKKPNRITQDVPPRAATALAFLHLALVIEAPFHDGPHNNTARKLSRKEEATRESALIMLNQYFMGEIDLGDLPYSGAIEEEEPPLPVIKKAKVTRRRR